MRAHLAVLTCLVAAVAAFEPHRVTSLPAPYPPLLSRNYAGYLNLTGTNQGRKTFYYFVESQGNPATDPLVLWLQGGPGCSGLMGFTTENGPYILREGGVWSKNDFAWTTKANILYIESPPGVGFSIDTVPAKVWDDDSTAQLNYESLQAFLKLFPQLLGRAFYITGESYGGHYCPTLAQRIFEGPDAQLKHMMKGWMVGNPCTGDIGCPNPDPTLLPFLQYNGFAALNYTDMVNPNPNDDNYDPYDLLEPTCPNLMLAKTIRFPHPIVDRLKRRLAAGATPPAPYGPCAENFMTSFFNRVDVQRAIHAEVGINWQGCNSSSSWNYDLLNYKSMVPIYQQLMDGTNWSILVYSGLDDSIVNQAQTQTIIAGMGRRRLSKEFKPWNLPYVYDPAAKQLGGFWIEYDRISWAGVRDSGHMVPQFNPPAALELFTSYLLRGRPGRM